MAENINKRIEISFSEMNHSTYTKILEYVQSLPFYETKKKIPQDAPIGKPLFMTCTDMKIDGNEPVYKNVKIILPKPFIEGEEKATSDALKGLADKLFSQEE